ncbi:MAG: CdaR family transcriptional regulator [Pseudonocardiales bacterium]|nr:MAG: CdaR family transcriptional regulator [Pseudonocardiales bacterium]
MRELVNRLSALDADAAENLKVIVYFDALIDGRAGLEAFLRGAAVLTGCRAGLVYPEHRISMRVDANGRRIEMTPPIDIAQWPQRRLADDCAGVVWIEREAGLHPNDAMVLERFGVGVRITIERTRVGSADDDAAAVEVLLDPSAGAEAHRRAAWRLGVEEQPQVLVRASPVATRQHPPARSTVITTVAGRVRASIQLPQMHLTDSVERAGIGPSGPVAELPTSWLRALTALRLTTATKPVVRWEDLGPLTILVAGADAMDEPHPDVALIERCVALGPWAGATLEALASTDSERSAATLLGVHHSTVHARRDQLDAVLGYSVGASSGRSRLTLALALYHLRTNRFDDATPAPAEHTGH